MLIDEQLKLHFGDTYLNVVSQATRFCKTVVNKPWWQDRSTLLNNEGGMQGMRRSSLCSIIEREDIIPDGLKAYGLYLRREYGKTKVLTMSWEELTSLVNIEDYSSPSTIKGQPVGTLMSPRLGPPQGAGSLAGLQPLYDLLQAHDTLRYSESEKRLEELEKNIFSDVDRILQLLNMSVLEREFFETYASVRDVGETCAILTLPVEVGWKIWKRVRARAQYLTAASVSVA